MTFEESIGNRPPPPEIGPGVSNSTINRESTGDFLIRKGKEALIKLLQKVGLQKAKSPTLN